MLLCAALLALALSGCSMDNNDTEPEAAGLMAFNLAPDQPLAGIALSGRMLPGPLPYTSYTGAYLRVYPGKRTVTSYDARTGETLAQDSASLSPRKYYSLFLVGDGDSHRNIMVADGLDTLHGMEDKAYLRCINAIDDPAAPEVNVTASGITLDTTLAFGSLSPFTALPAGDVSIRVSFGGGAATERTIQAEEQKVYTVLLLGNPAAASGSSDTLQIRYVPNGTLMVDTTAAKAERAD